MACVVDRDAAVREVAQVYELIKLQQPLLFLHSPPTQQLAQSLLGKALRALNIALSVMNQQPPAAPATPPPVKAEPQLSPPCSPASADSQAATMAPARRGASKRRRSSAAPPPTEGKKTNKTTPSSSWSTVTAVPYDDGYEWRKYGEKKINGTLFTRSYFRCTYKDESGCLATKHVQQMETNNSSSDPAIMFHVTYNNDHSCNCNTSAKLAAAAKTNTASSSSNLAALLAGCCDMKQEEPTTGHAAAAAAAAAAMKMKQEPQVLLPALVDLQPSSACLFPHEQIPRCQELLFPVTMERVSRHDDGEIPSASGSCISGETSCGWDIDMAAAQDDPLQDLERFLFMDY